LQRQAMWRKPHMNFACSAEHACQANIEPLHAESAAFFELRADRGVCQVMLCGRITTDTPVILKTTCRCGLPQRKDLRSCTRGNATPERLIMDRHFAPRATIPCILRLTRRPPAEGSHPIVGRSNVPIDEHVPQGPRGILTRTSCPRISL
jgi:hypothetical protein